MSAGAAVDVEDKRMCLVSLGRGPVTLLVRRGAKIGRPEQPTLYLDPVKARKTEFLGFAQAESLEQRGIQMAELYQSQARSQLPIPTSDI